MNNVIHANVTCEMCGHRAPWDIAMSPGVVMIPCAGCKELLQVEVTQEVIDKANGWNRRLPPSLSAWAGVIAP